MKRQHGQRIVLYVKQERHHRKHVHRKSRTKLSARDTFYHHTKKNKKGIVVIDETKERARLSKRNEYREHGNALLAQTIGGGYNQQRLKKRNLY